jgi:hypothetical protein
VWKSIRRKWEGFSKFVRYEVGGGSTMQFGMIYGVGNNL